MCRNVCASMRETALLCRQHVVLCVRQELLPYCLFNCFTGVIFEHYGTMAWAFPVTASAFEKLHNLASFVQHWFCQENRGLHGQRAHDFAEEVR